MGKNELLTGKSITRHVSSMILKELLSGRLDCEGIHPDCKGESYTAYSYHERRGDIPLRKLHYYLLHLENHQA